MKTEFLIPFEIDTTAVENKLNNAAYDEVVAKLTKKFESSLPKKMYGGGVDWSNALYTVLTKFLEDHSEEIIDTAVLMLAQKAGNRKRWRDVLKEIKEDTKED